MLQRGEGANRGLLDLGPGEPYIPHDNMAPVILQRSMQAESTRPNVEVEHNPYSTLKYGGLERSSRQNPQTNSRRVDLRFRQMQVIVQITPQLLLWPVSYSQSICSPKCGHHIPSFVADVLDLTLICATATRLSHFKNKRRQRCHRW